LTGAIREATVKNRRAVMKFHAPLFGLLAACAASRAEGPQEIPEPLRTATGDVLSQRLHATGVQIYQCRAGKEEAARFEWQFKEPAAELFTPSGKPAGKHYAGPSWQARDGSTVVGELVARTDGTQPGAIAWLLLRAKSTSGAGIFARVRFIERLHTVGGSAPTGGCDEGSAGQEVQVPYSADYWFYE